MNPDINPYKQCQSLCKLFRVKCDRSSMVLIWKCFPVMFKICFQFLARAEVEFASEYNEFGCKCEKFAADLVNAVDNSDDIMILLSLKKKSSGVTLIGEPLIRLQYALEHNHKLVSKRWSWNQLHGRSIIQIIIPDNWSNCSWFSFYVFWFLQKTVHSGGKKTILWNNIICYAFDSEITTYRVFEKIQLFSEKPIVSFLKKKFVCFEKSYYFSRILLQICENLVIKNYNSQNRQTSDTYPLASKR